MRVHVVTVGGSPEPIITSINQVKPDVTVYICSKDGTAVKGSYTQVPEFLGRTCKHEHKIIEVTADSLEEVYGKVTEVIENHLAQGHEVTVDYTGGTKSMSAGAVLAASEYPEVELKMVSGLRLDLVKITGIYHSVKKVSNNLPHKRRQLTMVKKLLSEYQYSGAIALLAELSCEDMLTAEEQLGYYAVQGLACWDEYQYTAAYEGLKKLAAVPAIKPLIGSVGILVKALEWIQSYEKQPAEKNFQGQLLAYDLIRNSERNAARGRTDVAVLQLNRALEMYVQVILMQKPHNISPFNVLINKIPEPLTVVFESYRDKQGVIKISVHDCLELLVVLDDATKETITGYRKKLTDVISSRNESFLAHGYTLVDMKTYVRMRKIIVDFIAACDIVRKIDHGIEKYPEFPKAII